MFNRRMETPVRWHPATELVPEKVDRILRRLAKGHAKARIAREENVSRTTVIKLSKNEHISQRKNSPTYERCAGCGAPVIMPCLACSLTGQVSN